MVTKVIHVNLAVNLGGDGHVRPVTIMIDGTKIRELVGVGSDWQKESLKFYNEEAKLIVDSLVTALPGGTIDQVIALLLERRASLFSVPFFPAKEV